MQKGAESVLVSSGIMLDVVLNFISKIFLKRHRKRDQSERE